MARTDPDRHVLESCLQRKPDATRSFVEQFAGLLYRVIGHVAHMHDIKLNEQQLEELAGHVVSRIAADDFALLRDYRGKAKLRTYLAVLFRRLVIARLNELRATFRTANGPPPRNDSQ